MWSNKGVDLVGLSDYMNWFSSLYFRSSGLGHHRLWKTSCYTLLLEHVDVLLHELIFISLWIAQSSKGEHHYGTKRTAPRGRQCGHLLELRGQTLGPPLWLHVGSIVLPPRNWGGPLSWPHGGWPCAPPRGLGASPLGRLPSLMRAALCCLLETEGELLWDASLVYSGKVDLSLVLFVF